MVVSTQKRKNGPQLSDDGIELSDGGVIEWPDSDGTIRRRDKDGNTEEVRNPGDPRLCRVEATFRLTPTKSSVTRVRRPISHNAPSPK